jgi:molybdate transport repressor ModE-like protein
VTAALDWNDIRLILAIRRLGSFTAAAAALGVDQATVSRRISRLEDVAGAPLFRRARTGAVATETGQYLLEKAATVEDRATDFQNALREVRLSRRKTVVVQTSEGVSSYLLSPLISGDDIGPMSKVLASDRSIGGFPATRVISDASPEPADIRLVWTSPTKGPTARNTDHVRKIASVPFVPFFSKAFHRNVRRQPKKFEQITQTKVLTLSPYTFFDEDDALGPWNAIVDTCEEPCFSVTSTPSLARPLLHGSGVSLLPTYASMFSPEIFQYDFKVPPMFLDLWLYANEDNLRSPEVRKCYDLIGKAFSSFPWSS